MEEHIGKIFRVGIVRTPATAEQLAVIAGVGLLATAAVLGILRGWSRLVRSAIVRTQSAEPGSLRVGPLLAITDSR